MRKRYPQNAGSTLTTIQFLLVKPMTSSGMQVDAAMKQSVQWLREADGLLITAVAGMGVDSGLPDFRGTEGFWRAYPALKADGLHFEDIANPAAFRRDPELAWGFYGHRLNLYRHTTPHAGYGMLSKWAEQMHHGAFVFTSNVDGHFSKAGFEEDRIAECHGSIHHLQCTDTCTKKLWPADAVQSEIDEERCRLLSAIPTCPDCGAVARPNILMFGDWDWVGSRASWQQARLERWLSGLQKLVVVELGAGRAIPTVRNLSVRSGPRVIRINPREFSIDPSKGVGIALAALDTLTQLDTLLWVV